MRIAIVSIYKEAFGGGEALVAFELARRLAVRHEVLVVCPGARTEVVRERSGLAVLTVESGGGEEVSFPRLGRRARARVFALLEEFGPDVVHAHGPVMLGMFALAWARARRVPFVTTPHFVPHRLLEFPSGARALVLVFRAIQPLVNAYLVAFLRSCDAVIALNRAVAESARAFAPKTTVFTIPNGRNLEPLRQCRITAPGAGTRTLCFIGYLAARKNQLYLLRMLTCLPATYRLRLVGKALVPRYERELRELVARQGLANVEFTGAVGYDRVPSLLEQAHLFVSASVLEAQSLVIIEALASGTPVVGLANETVDELVDDAVGHRLPKGAPPAEFAKWVDRICSLPRPQYEEMARRARARVERMDWKPVVDATVRAYESRIAAPAGILTPSARFFAAANNLICSLLFRTQKRPPAARPA